MNSYDAPRQPVTACRKGDLLDAQDILSDIVQSQKYLDIINILLRESLIEVDPGISLLLDCYEAAAVPAKLQAATDLIESVRKSLP
jgi:hypothetical protein